MKYSITVKFIAIVLCSLSLLSIAVSGIGLVFAESYDLHSQSPEEFRQDQLEAIANEIAWYHTHRYAAETLSNCSTDMINELYYSYYISEMWDQYAVELYEAGELVYSAYDAGSFPEVSLHDFVITSNYPIISSQYIVDEYGDAIDAPEELVIVDGFTEPATEAPAATETILPTEPSAETIPEEATGPADEAAAATEALRETLADETPLVTADTTSGEAGQSPLARPVGQTPLYSSEHTDFTHGVDGEPVCVVYTLDYYTGPEYEVRVYLSASTIFGVEFTIATLLYRYQEYLIPGLLICLLIFAVTLVYLCSAAGRNRAGEVQLAVLNRIPIDLYAVIACGVIALLAVPIFWLMESYYRDIWNNLQLCLLIFGLCGFGIALSVTGFLYALAAQLKAKDGYWWRHSLCGFLLCLLFKGMRYVFRGFGCIGKAFSCVGRSISAVIQLLPVIWQWLLTAAIMVAAVGLTCLLAAASYGYSRLFWMLLCLVSVLGCVAVICYGGYCFGTLLKGAKVMSQGNLNHKIDTKYLYGAFKDFAIQLNSLAGAAQIAAERQMKSERMKTELITNVSHDIKTPLTSIINYVDLMKKPHTESDNALYLEVLDRQSQRLKKLIDDLIEMSKASSGSLTVELGRVDAVEAVNQALGEFADKLERSRLTPVFRHPDFPVTMAADGRLVWRVLSNLLNNAVKYALPDTRVYIDLMVLQGNAVIAIKNISRDQLNVNADELMERFVRGDASRNTEGSGLGLNIAKSLVELQHGQMHLMVDGDLFKVTLIFPCC